MPLFPSHLRRTPQAGDPVPQAGATATSLLKRYRPLETRATGGFGSVEICLDVRLQRRVAIKRIPLAPTGAQTVGQTTADALAEARTASMLQHPHIVSVIDFTYDAAYAYLVMEYIDGMSLEEFLAQVEGNSLTYDEAACLADALVQALEHAHENGVLHLDIKPGNVLIDRNGHIKLADFGMAKLTSAAGYGGARGGTLGYMAPEQLRGDLVDERSDIFSLACVVYEALCGDAPFRAATPADSEQRIEQGVTPPSDLLPDIPQSAEDALLCALSPTADARMESVSDFGDELLDSLGNVREGQRSFARLIARLTSDEVDPDAALPLEEPKPFPGWDVDPAEGLLGSRFPHARRALTAAVSGISVAAASHLVLAGMGSIDQTAGAFAALAIGAGAALAPQLGSALIATGLLLLIVTHTPLLSVLPVAALMVAVVCAWWLVWGRVTPEASAAMTLACALACATPAGDLALLAVPFAALTLADTASVSSVATGMLLGKLLACAHAAGGTLTTAAAAGFVAAPGFLIMLVGAGATALALSSLLSHAWLKHSDDGGQSPAKGPYAAAYALATLGVLLSCCLAHTVEITSVDPTWTLTAAALAILSPILIRTYVYLFGYRKDLTKE